MKVSELIVGNDDPKGENFDLLSGFYVWTTREEDKLLEKLKDPIRLAQLSEHDQFRVQALIRKSLVTKIGTKDPTVVTNEKYQK
jgi:hypothetical protein